MYALHHPELFSSACLLSASVGPLNLEDAKRRYNRTRRNQPNVELKPVSAEQIEAYLKRHSAVQLVQNMPAEDIKSVRWFIDCGDDDFLFEGNSLVHIAMRKRDIPHEYRVRDGGHRWSYWRASLPKVLSFVSESFHQN